VVTLIERQRRRERATAAPHAPLADPYAVAYLRGGPVEAVRVAVATLLDRGAIEADDSWLSATPRDTTSPTPSYAPLEEAVLAYITPGPGLLSHAMDDPGLRIALRPIEEMLVERGFMPTPEQQQGRGLRCVLAGVLLWMVAIAQIANRDPRYGVGFLLFLAVGFTALAAWASFRRRTAAGDDVLADMKELLQGQHDSLARGGGHVPALVMAVFGFAVLSHAAEAIVRKVVPPQSSTVCSSGGCGSSGSSGDSSCGGGGCGGCGGGCGGCGGCGG
jgi:uncharacterized protein (TIGR04222 family)